MTPTRLILVRHGEPSEEVHGHCYGRLDPPLSDLGRRQIRRVGRWLAGLADVEVCCSPLRRAVESATLLAHAGPIAIDDRLREIDFGALEGLTYTEIEQRHPDVFRAWMAHPTEVTFPDGEPFVQMAARVERAAAELRHRRAGRTTVVVSHGGVNRIVLASALHMPLASMFRLGQDYGCVNVIDYAGDEAIVRAVNLRLERPC
jgi:alpha-ribazole phosphatase